MNSMVQQHWKSQLRRGLRNLPRSVYNNYFQIRSQGVPTMTTDSKKVWLLLIRSAREAYLIHQLTSFPIVIYSENGWVRSTRHHILFYIHYNSSWLESSFLKEQGFGSLLQVFIHLMPDHLGVRSNSETRKNPFECRTRSCYNIYS